MHFTVATTTTTITTTTVFLQPFLLMLNNKILNDGGQILNTGKLDKLSYIE